MISYSNNYLSKNTHINTMERLITIKHLLVIKEKTNVISKCLNTHKYGIWDVLNMRPRTGGKYYAVCHSFTICPRFDVTYIIEFIKANNRHLIKTGCIACHVDSENRLHIGLAELSIKGKTSLEALRMSQKDSTVIDVETGEPT